jgi:hypothetical protein
MSRMQQTEQVIWKDGRDGPSFEVIDRVVNHQTKRRCDACDKFKPCTAAEWGRSRSFICADCGGTRNLRVGF